MLVNKDFLHGNTATSQSDARLENIAIIALLMYVMVQHYSPVCSAARDWPLSC